MKKLEIVKDGIEIVVSIGVGMIVGNAVVFTTPANTKLIGKLCIKAGSLVLSGIASEKASKYVSVAIDENVEQIRAALQEKTPEQEGEIETA